MNKFTERDIRAHAVRDYPRESCGLIVAIGKREKYIACPNIAPNKKSGAPADYFRMPAEAYADAEEIGDVIAVVHSHPDMPAMPTHADLDACEASKLPWTIVHVSKNDAGEVVTGDIHSFAPSGYVTPILGVPFTHGVHDCYSLAQRWYKQEWGVILPHFEREDMWWTDGVQNLYLENYKSAGFVEVPGGVFDLQVGDAILMQIHSKEFPNHCGVYIDGGYQWMVHHMYGQLSCRAVYGGQWLEATRMVLRYAGPQ